MPNGPSYTESQLFLGMGHEHQYLLQVLRISQYIYPSCRTHMLKEEETVLHTKQRKAAGKRIFKGLTMNHKSTDTKLTSQDFDYYVR